MGTTGKSRWSPLRCGLSSCCPWADGGRGSGPWRAGGGGGGSEGKRDTGKDKERINGGKYESEAGESREGQARWKGKNPARWRTGAVIANNSPRQSAGPAAGRHPSRKGSCDSLSCRDLSLPFLPNQVCPCRRWPGPRNHLRQALASRARRSPPVLRPSCVPRVAP